MTCTTAFSENYTRTVDDVGEDTDEEEFVSGPITT
jgi:hypothetical protein